MRVGDIVKRVSNTGRTSFGIVLRTSHPLDGPRKIKLIVLQADRSFMPVWTARGNLEVIEEAIEDIAVAAQPRAPEPPRAGHQIYAQQFFNVYTGN